MRPAARFGVSYPRACAPSRRYSLPLRLFITRRGGGAGSGFVPLTAARRAPCRSVDLGGACGRCRYGRVPRRRSLDRRCVRAPPSAFSAATRGARGFWFRFMSNRELNGIVVLELRGGAWSYPRVHTAGGCKRVTRACLPSSPPFIGAPAFTAFSASALGTSPTRRPLGASCAAGGALRGD